MGRRLGEWRKGLYKVFLIFYAGLRDGDVGFGVV